jgi:hypothetical protein
VPPAYHGDDFRVGGVSKRSTNGRGFQPSPAPSLLIHLADRGIIQDLPEIQRRVSYGQSANGSQVWDLRDIRRGNKRHSNNGQIGFVDLPPSFNDLGRYASFEQLGKLPWDDWPAEVVPLGFVAVMSLKKCQLIFCFHAFSNNPEFQASAHADDRGYYCRLISIYRDLTHEGLIDLEGIDWVDGSRPPNRSQKRRSRSSCWTKPSTTTQRNRSGMQAEDSFRIQDFAWLLLRVHREQGDEPDQPHRPARLRGVPA